MLYCPWDNARDGCNYFSFWAFFALLPLLTAQRIKISKKWKKSLEISRFYTCVPKIIIRWCTVPEIWCAREGGTDGRKKWHIEVGAPPKKNHHLHVNEVTFLTEQNTNFRFRERERLNKMTSILNAAIYQSQ